MPTVAQLMNALPEDVVADRTQSPAVAEWSMRPVPVGRLRRSHG